MIKLILISLICLSSLNARENPFFDADDKQGDRTSNAKIINNPLKQASISLPSTARVIEGVTINYKSLDGSKHTQSIMLDNSIDWHLPIFISQSYENAQNATESKKSEKEQKRNSYKHIASLQYISFYANKENLKVVTQDEMIRNFLLVNPHRIVFDVKRDIDIRSYSKEMAKNSIFTKIRIGNHSGYYRVVIELDGSYSYKLIKSDNG